MTRRPESPSEFDSYADKYTGLLKDPMRDRFASDRRFFHERKLQVIERFFRERGKDTHTMSWLDIGCGQGDLLRLGRNTFANAIGCDPSEKMLEACADLNVRLQPSRDRLPFDDAHFDFVTAVCVYHHVPLAARGALTTEALRVTKPGGCFCVIEHNPLNPITRLIVSRAPIDADAELLTARETQRLLLEAGTRNLACRYFLFFPERIYRPFAGLEDRLGILPLGGQYAVFAERVPHDGPPAAR